MIDTTSFTLEELAHALYMKMEEAGFPKGTDKTKWREPVMAKKLGHTAHTKISAGKGSDDYGSDATTADGQKAEYKTRTIEDANLRNLLELPKGSKGKTFAAMKIGGVYNGYNSNYETASVKYATVDHYFGVFYKERCVLIIKPHTDEVMRQLNANYAKFASKKSGTTNLNTVTINLSNTDTYEVAYKDEQFYSSF